KPFFNARTVLQTDEEESIRAELKKLHDRLDHPDAESVAVWEKEKLDQLALRGENLQLLPAAPLKVSTPNRGSGFEIEGREVRIQAASDLVAYDVSLKLPQTDLPITGLRVVFRPDDQMPGKGWGFGPSQSKPRRNAPTKTPPALADDVTKGSFVLTSFSASADAVPGDQINLHHLLPVRAVTANSSQENYPAEGCLDPRNETGWAPDLSTEGPVHLTVTFAKPISVEQTPYLTAQVNFGHGRSLVASRFEFFAMTGNDDGSALPEELISILQNSAANRSPEQSKQLCAWYSAHSHETKPQRIALANLEERLAVLTQEFPTMVMDVAAKPRETHILNRGDYMQPGEVVTAGTPAALPALPEGAPTNRLGLAQWITMRGNPLTARVAVNRFWQMFFGIGLVKTAADFGSQGEWPSHPELLDWLAVDFMDSGWNVKALLRKIVLSAAYRQSSVASPALLERDPQNRLLARGPRYRLPAELIRDVTLKVSGLLVPRLGGPGVNPYTPGDLWREISHYGSTPATAQTFVQDHGEKLYRRSLYTFWKRTAPPPNMAAFDAPNREVCVVKRADTTTPLQALVMLNDVQFVEAARAFAGRIIHHQGDDEGQMRWAFEECLSRPPSKNELEVLTRVLQRERQRYAADPGAAQAYLSNGESPRDENIPAPEHAAWSQVTALLFNLSETVTRI
ncbi:MAG TPA: DUF1553 domain-containing protein, partial [Verrucomicrobiaceae bacterium]